MSVSFGGSTTRSPGNSRLSGPVPSSAMCECSTNAQLPWCSSKTGQYNSQWKAICSVVEKVGASSETLRKWVRQTEWTPAPGRVIWQAEQRSGLSQVVDKERCPYISRVIEAGYFCAAPDEDRRGAAGPAASGPAA